MVCDGVMVWWCAMVCDGVWCVMVVWCVMLWCCDAVMLCVCCSHHLRTDRHTNSLTPIRTLCLLQWLDNAPRLKELIHDHHDLAFAAYGHRYFTPKVHNLLHMPKFVEVYGSCLQFSVCDTHEILEAYGCQQRKRSKLMAWGILPL